MKQDWTDNFITTTPEGKFVAWDETQADELGTFDSRFEAVQALRRHAKQLEDTYPEDYIK